MATTNRKPAVTNGDLNRLLVRLGFQLTESMEKHHQVWRHPDAATVIFLPANKSDEPALEVDLHSVRTHLDYDGHLESDDFDDFVKTGKQPVG